MTHQNKVNNTKRRTLKKRPKRLPLFILEKIKDASFFSYISLNENALDFLTLPENYSRINWSYLSSNESPKAISLLENNLSKIDWVRLSNNPSAVHILKSNKGKIDWSSLCSNKNKDVYPLLEEKVKSTNNNYGRNKINWNRLFSNRSLDISDLVEKEFEKPKSKNNVLKTFEYRFNLSYNGNHTNLLDNNKRLIEWNALSANKYAMNLIREELKNKKSRINWRALCLNENAIDILTKESKKEPNRIDWPSLCENENAIGILAKEAKKDVNRICWETLSQNKKATRILAKELKRKDSDLYIHYLITHLELIPLIKPIISNDTVFINDICVTMASIPDIRILNILKKNFSELSIPAIDVYDNDLVQQHEKDYARDFWSNLLSNPLLFQL